jgi:hypothetical protein
MARISLTDVQNLQSEGAAVAAINGNMDVIEDFSAEALTKSGPNTLESDVDMNSHRIINLPEAVNPTSPVRKQEFDETVGDLDALLAELAAAQISVDTAVDEAAVSAAASAASAALSAAQVGDAEDWAMLAEKWANEDVGVVVEGGLFSAKHWAAQAQEIVQGDFSANANTVTFTPTGSIAATNVQTAIAEVATEYAAADALKVNITSLSDQTIDANLQTLRYEFGFDPGTVSLNTILTPGFYRLNGTQTAGPSGWSTAGFLVVQSNTDDTVVHQTLHAGNTTWMRSFGGGSWAAWVRMFGEGSLVTVTGIHDKTANGLAYTKTMWDALDHGTDQTPISGAVTFNMNTGINRWYQLNGNVTFNNPTNVFPGQSGVLVFQQDATGSRTITWGNAWKFPNNIPPNLNSTASSFNAIYYHALSTTVVLCSFVRY